MPKVSAKGNLIKKTSILWIFKTFNTLKTFKSEVLQRRLLFPQKKLKTMRSQNVGGKHCGYYGNAKMANGVQF